MPSNHLILAEKAYIQGSYKFGLESTAEDREVIVTAGSGGARAGGEDTSTFSESSSVTGGLTNLFFASQAG